MKAEVKAVRPIFRLLCCLRGLRKISRGLRPRNFTPKKLSRAVKNLPSPYGLNQASRSWHKRLVVHVKSVGFEQTHADTCVRRLVEPGSIFIDTLVHVDDIFLQWEIRVDATSSTKT